MINESWVRFVFFFSNSCVIWVKNARLYWCLLWIVGAQHARVENKKNFLSNACELAFFFSIKLCSIYVA